MVALCPPGEWLPGQLRAAGVPVWEMALSGPRACATALSLPRLVREHQVDVIHAHLTRATYYALAVGRLADRPVVSSVHVHTRDFVYRRLFPQRANCIITVSNYLRDNMVRQGIPAARVRTIYNGTNFFDPLAAETETEDPEQANASALPVRVELSLPPDAELVGIFARVEEFKGHFVLVEALKEIVARRPRAYFLCVGPVEPETQRALWERAAQDGLTERLRFTGTRNDVARLMAATDLVILPSRYEACSMAIIEAMAMGKPVVATRAGGNPELIVHGETGLLIERTPAELAAAIVQALSDDAFRQRMGEAAQKRALEHFSASVMVQQIEALYQEVIATEAARV